MAKLYCALVAALLLAAVPFGSAATNDKKASSADDLYKALTDQSVTSIGLNPPGGSLSLEPYTAAIYAYKNRFGAFEVQRDLRFYNYKGGSVTMDLAYLASFIKVQSGRTLTFDGLTLLRSQVLSPIGAFQYSPGATVLMTNSVQVMEVCYPQDYARFFFLQWFQRPFAGTNTADVCNGQTQDTCNQYIFTDIAFGLPLIQATNTGGYNMWYKNSKVVCQHYSNPQPPCDYQNQPLYCISQVLPAAALPVSCPLCTCINGCRDLCNTAGQPGC